jgi:hypothetical protein
VPSSHEEPAFFLLKRLPVLLNDAHLGVVEVDGRFFLLSFIESRRHPKNMTPAINNGPLALTKAIRNLPGIRCSINMTATTISSLMKNTEDLLNISFFTTE